MKKQTKLNFQAFIDQDAKSFADTLKVTVDDLKEIKVSLYDIVTVRYDEEIINIFSDARSVFKASNFYTVAALLKMKQALLAESVDAVDSKSTSERSASSSLAEGTNKLEN